MARYGKKAEKAVQKSMKKKKAGKLKSGSSGKPVKSRKQAVAIGLSEARKEGSKVPKKKKAVKTTKKKATRKKPARKSTKKKTGASKAKKRTRAKTQ